MSITADIHCEISLDDGVNWWPIATFVIGSARRFRVALQGAGLADRGLPSDVSELLRDGFNFQVAHAPEEVTGATYLTTQELPILLDAALWLSDEERERFPVHAFEGYAETDFIRAWHAFAQTHEAHKHPGRVVLWFTW